MPIEIRTDSQYSIQCECLGRPLFRSPAARRTAGSAQLKEDRKLTAGITKWAPGWIARGWKTSSGQPVKNVDMVRYLLHLVSARAAPVRLSYVRGHVGEAGNEAADFLARTGAARPLPPHERTYEVRDKVEDKVDEIEASVQLDESCLMSEEELRELERELADEP